MSDRKTDWDIIKEMDGEDIIIGIEPSYKGCLVGIVLHPSKNTLSFNIGDIEDPQNAKAMREKLQALKVLFEGLDADELSDEEKWFENVLRAYYQKPIEVPSVDFDMGPRSKIDSVLRQADIPLELRVAVEKELNLLRKNQLE